MLRKYRGTTGTVGGALIISAGDLVSLKANEKIAAFCTTSCHRLYSWCCSPYFHLVWQYSLDWRGSSLHFSSDRSVDTTWKWYLTCRLERLNDLSSGKLILSNDYTYTITLQQLLGIARQGRKLSPKESISGLDWKYLPSWQHCKNGVWVWQMWLASMGTTNGNITTIHASLQRIFLYEVHNVESLV